MCVCCCCSCLPVYLANSDITRTVGSRRSKKGEKGHYVQKQPQNTSFFPPFTILKQHGCIVRHQSDLEKQKKQRRMKKKKNTKNARRLLAEQGGREEKKQKKKKDNTIQLRKKKKKGTYVKPENHRNNNKEKRKRKPKTKMHITLFSLSSFDRSEGTSAKREKKKDILPVSCSFFSVLAAFLSPSPSCSTLHEFTSTQRSTKKKKSKKSCTDS